MSVQHNSSVSRTPDINDQDLITRYSATSTSSSDGVSGSPSSIQPRVLTNESGGGVRANICSWLTNLFSKICQLFSQLFRSSSSNTISRNSLESAINIADLVIDGHFVASHITDPANQQNSVIVTILKFNGQLEVSCGRTPSERSNVNGIKNQLRQLIIREYEQNRDGKIDIDTYFIKVNSDGTWSYYCKDSNFSLSTSIILGGSSANTRCGLDTILQVLRAATSNDIEVGERIWAVIRQL
jgi:hypothetical protein